MKMIREEHVCRNYKRIAHLDLLNDPPKEFNFFVVGEQRFPVTCDTGDEHWLIGQVISVVTGHGIILYVNESDEKDRMRRFDVVKVEVGHCGDTIIGIFRGRIVFPLEDFGYKFFMRVEAA
jgi:hypothetical protein